MSYFRTTDWFTEVAKGLVPLHSYYSTFGQNEDVDTAAAEDLWGYGANFVPPTTARIHDIVSTNVNDTSAGTGIRTLKIYGVTANGFETENITMNGTTNVPTSKSYYDIYNIEFLTYGSGGTNAGQITATAQTDATVTISVEVNGLNTPLRAVRYIPTGYKGYLYDFDSSMNNGVAGSSTTTHLLIRKNGLWVTIGEHILNNNGNSHEKDKFKPPYEFIAGTWIKLRCTAVTNNNTIVYGGFNLILKKDG